MTLPDGVFYDLNPALLPEGPIGAGVEYGTPVDVAGHPWVVDYDSNLVHNFTTQPLLVAESGGWWGSDHGLVLHETDPTIGTTTRSGLWAVCRNPDAAAGGAAGDVLFEIKDLGSHNGDALPLPEGVTELYGYFVIARAYTVYAIDDRYVYEFFSEAGASLGVEETGANANIAVPVPAGARSLRVTYRGVLTATVTSGETEVGLQGAWVMQRVRGGAGWPATPETDSDWTWDGAPGESSSTYESTPYAAVVEHAPRPRIVQVGTEYTAFFSGGSSGIVDPQGGGGVSTILSARISGRGVSLVGQATAAFPFNLDDVGFTYDEATSRLVFAQDPAVTLAPGDYVFGFVVSEAGVSVYVDGRLIAALSWDAPMDVWYGPNETRLVFTDSLYRLSVWDRALTSAEVAQATEAMTPSRQVSWTPGADGGSPITGYVLRVWDGVAMTETEYPADAVAGTIPASALAAQLVAVNALGAGSPAEVPL